MQYPEPLDVELFRSERIANGVDPVTAEREAANLEAAIWLDDVGRRWEGSYREMRIRHRPRVQRVACQLALL